MDRKAGSLTPTKTEETLANNAVSKTASHGHVRLPRLRQNPTEWRQEEEMQKSSHKSTNNLRKREWKKKKESPSTRTELTKKLENEDL